ncbi:hypothetical protein EPN96_02445 [bacterium]|nr:MAG: hypothetical protein EPN96_02445 [bacterium]
MKKAVLSMALVALTFVSLVAFAAEAGKEAKFTTITELLSAKDSTTDPVRFEGKVIKVFPKEKMLGLADPAKCATDCATPCDPPLLPVKWEGAMPEINTVVKVAGSVAKEDGKQVFVATSVNKAV